MEYYIKIVSVGFEGKDRTLIKAHNVSEDIAKLLIDKYGNAANRISIAKVENIVKE